MAITPHLGGSYVSGTDFTTYTSAASSTATLGKPSGVVDNVTLRAYVYSQVAAGAAMTPPTGWTLELALSARRGGIYRKTIPSAAAETATSYVWTAPASGRVGAAVWIVTGEAGTPVDVTGAWSTEASTATAAAVTAVGAADLLMAFVYWNASSATTSTVTVPGSMTKLLDISSPTTGNTSGIAVAMEQLSASGSTGTRAFSASPTPTNMSAVLVAFVPDASVTDSAGLSGSGTLAATGNPGVSVPASLSGAGALTTAAVPAVPGAVTLSGSGTLTAIDSSTPTGTATLAGSGALVAAGVPSPAGAVTLSGSGVLVAAGKPALAGAAALSGSGTLSTLTPVQKWLLNTPLYVAHRGGSADWPEMTMYAYAQAAAWNPNLALEVSVIRTSDGQWMASHDSTTDRVFGVHYDITTTPWSTLQTLRTTVGNQPPCLLTDVLAAYPDRIIFVDDKMNSFLTPFLDTLDAYGGASRIVVKGYGPQAGDITKAQAAIARGYQTWGYYYHADTANLAPTHSNWSILGEDAVGAPPGDATDWAAIKSYGKPVLAHIIATATQKTYADTFTPTGYMASGVMEVVPQTTASGTAALTGSGTLTAAGKTAVAGVPAFTGTGTLSVLATPGARGSVALAGAGVLAAGTGPQYFGGAALSGSGVLAAVGTMSSNLRDVTLTGHPVPVRWSSGPVAVRFTSSPAPNY